MFPMFLLLVLMCHTHGDDRREPHEGRRELPGGGGGSVDQLWTVTYQNQLCQHGKTHGGVHSDLGDWPRTLTPDVDMVRIM